MADATVVGQMIVGGGSIATIVGVGGGLWWQGKTAREKAEERAEARTKVITDGIAANQKTTDDRITAFEHATDIRLRGIEQTLGEHAGQFMPRDHIMTEFRHRQANREQSEAQIMRLHEQLAIQVRDNAIGLARTTEQTALLNSTLGEVKDELKTLTRWLGEKFDKLQAAVAGKAS